MKSILLTTTAIVAFAGAAVAEGHTGFSFKGNAELGYNDDAVVGEDGFYWNADADVTMSAALDNGVTAAATFELDVVNETNGEDLFTDGYVLSLTSENAGLYFGDTGFAAKGKWSAAGDMESDGFSDNDGENVIRGEVTVAGISAAISYAVTDAGGDFVDEVTTGYTEKLDQMSVGVAGDLGMVSFTVAYQEESVALADFVVGAAAVADAYDPSNENGDFNVNEIFGASASVAVAGADVKVAYATDVTADTTSMGVQVAYPFGPVTATAYYVSEDTGAGDVDDNYGLTVAYADGPIAATAKIRNEQGRDEWNLEGSYDVGNGLTVYAGMLNEDEVEADYYVAGTYDLGGGAELMVSYAEDANGDQADEIGSAEYLPGTTVEVSFKF